MCVIHLVTRSKKKDLLNIRYRDQLDTLLPNEAPSPLPLGEQLDFSASNHDKQVDSIHENMTVPTEIVGVYVCVYDRRVCICAPE